MRYAYCALRQSAMGHRRTTQHYCSASAISGTAAKSDACVVLIGSRRCPPLRPLRRAFNALANRHDKQNKPSLSHKT